MMFMWGLRYYKKHSFIYNLCKLLDIIKHFAPKQFIFHCIIDSFDLRIIFGISILI